MEETRDKLQEPNADSPGGGPARKLEEETALNRKSEARPDPDEARPKRSGPSDEPPAAGAKPAITATKPGAKPHATSQQPPPRAQERQPAPASPRRSGGWLAMLLALGAVAASGYAVFRVQTADDGSLRLRQDLETLRSEVQGTTAIQGELRREVEQLTTAQQSANEALRARIESLQTLRGEVAALPGEVAALRATVSEMRSRPDLPRQSAALFEARALLGLGEQRLAIDRDVTAATTALETADRLLGELDEPALAEVRGRIASDLAALRAVPQPDRAALASRLAEAERRVTTLPLTVPVPGEPATATPSVPDSGPARAWALIQQAFSDLITVRRNGDADSLASADLAAIRRQHLELLLLTARASLLRADQAAYESSLESARAWLDRHFASDATPVVALRDELTALEQIEVAPALPDISGSAALLADLPIPPAGETP